MHICGLEIAELVAVGVVVVEGKHLDISRALTGHIL